MNCKNGHGVVICGYLETRNEKKLLIRDPNPDLGDLVSVPYDDGTYLYQNTTYPDKK